MVKKYLVALDDGHGLMDTPGKRTPYITEIGRQIRENEFNSAVVTLLDIELKRCGIDTLLVAPTDKDDSLQLRVKRANEAKADIYVSIHYDAFDSKFDGYDPEGLTVFYANGSTKGKKLAECVHQFLKQGTRQQDRGIKPHAFYVLKYTNMPSILTENGFMDNKREALLMIDKAFQKEVAVEHAKGICKFLNVTYVAESKSTITAPTSNTTKKEKVIKLLKDSTASSLRNEFIADLEKAYANKVFSDKKWIELAKSGELTLADAFLLKHKMDKKK